jgi:hypothetical protein
VVISGLVLAMAVSALLLPGVINSWLATAIGIPGIGLISIFDHWKNGNTP